METREQLDFAREIGCELVQGFCFQKPESLEELLFGIRGGDTVRPCVTPEEREKLNRKWLHAEAVTGVHSDGRRGRLTIREPAFNIYK